MSASPETVSTANLLINCYPVLLTQAHLASIFGQHIQTIRRLARSGKLPFVNVSLTPSKKRYRLADVISYLENPPAQAQAKDKCRGRPVGSKNRKPPCLP